MQRKYFDIHTRVGRAAVRDRRFPYDVQTLLDDLSYYRVHGALIANEETVSYNYFIGNRNGEERANTSERLWTDALVVPDPHFESDGIQVEDIIFNPKNVAIRWAPKSLKHSSTPRAMERTVEATVTADKPVIVSVKEIDWDALEAILDAFCELKLILTDSTWGTNRFLFSLLERYPNLHFEISYNQANDILELTRRYFGIERALFGSGYPDKIMGGLKALVEYADISESDKDAVAACNALRLLSIPKDALLEYEEPPTFDEMALAMDRGEPLRKVFVVDAHAHMTGMEHTTVSDLVIRNGNAAHMKTAMDTLGIDLSIAVPWEGISTDGIAGNRTMVQAMRDFPGRYLAYASCNPNYDEDLQSVIEDFHEKQPGFVGIKPYYPKHGYDVLGDLYRPWYEYANRHRLLLLMHTGSANIHEKIPVLCERYPQISFILAHSGNNYANCDRMIAVVKRFENAYLEITYTSLTRGIIEYMVDHVGADRVLFGTDTPMRDPAPQLAWVAYAKISIEDKIKIMGGNMIKLLESVQTDMPKKAWKKDEE